jgi:energy-coupling factor transporter transmembrane protein EcfT
LTIKAGSKHLSSAVRFPIALVALQSIAVSCRYTFFKFAFLSVSRFSLGLGLSAGAVTFSLLQLTALFLVTTPPEQMALSFRWFISPLKLVGVPVDRATFSLLLALRFVSLVRTHSHV